MLDPSSWRIPNLLWLLLPICAADCHPELDPATGLPNEQYFGASCSTFRIRRWVCTSAFDDWSRLDVLQAYVRLANVSVLRCWYLLHLFLW